MTLGAGKLKGVKWTKRGIEAVVVSKRQDFTDPSEKGLKLRVTPTGGKSWALLYHRRSDGKKRRVTLGQFPTIGLADARAKAAALKVEIHAGGDPANAVTAFKALDTVNELLDRYLKDYAEPNKRSAHEDRRIFNKDVRPHIGSHKVTTVTKSDVLAIANAVKDRGAGVSANRTIAILRRAFAWGLQEGYMVSNPAAGIKPRTKESPRDRTLSAAEIKTFWKGLAATRIDEGTKIALRLALVTGQRIGEVCSAERQEIDFDKALWVIPSAKTKNRREHSVSLSSMAVVLFKRAISLAGDGKFMFPSHRSHSARTSIRPIKPTSVAHAMQGSRDRLGLANLPATPHDLRRTVASHLASMGVGENIVGRILNHATHTRRTVTGSVYIRYEFAAEKRQALEAWADELTRIIGSEPESQNAAIA